MDIMKRSWDSRTVIDPMRWLRTGAATANMSMSRCNKSKPSHRWLMMCWCWTPLHKWMNQPGYGGGRNGSQGRIKASSFPPSGKLVWFASPTAHYQASGPQYYHTLVPPFAGISYRLDQTILQHDAGHQDSGTG